MARDGDAFRGGISWNLIDDTGMKTTRFFDDSLEIGKSLTLFERDF